MDCLLKYKRVVCVRAVKTEERVEIQLRVISNSALDGSELWDPRLGR
jgi:hypothetical protein